MANGALVEATRDWIIVKIPRRLVKAKKEVTLSVRKALKVFRKGKEEYRAGKLKPVASLKDLL